MCGRRGGAVAPRRARGSRVGLERLALRRPPGAAELHTAAELSRPGRAGRIVERRSRQDCGMAGGASRKNRRGSGRGKGENSGGAVSLKKKKNEQRSRCSTS